MSPAPLEGLGVLVTRPADRARGFASAVQAEGGRAILFPAVEIGPRSAEQITGELAPLQSAESPLFIFVSAYAVTHGLPAVAEVFAEPGLLATAAVGDTTAQRLAEAGCRNILAPAAGVGSEALLETLADEPVAGRQIIILRGPSGREALARELRKRGARVAQISVYERKSPAVDGTDISAALNAGKIDVVTISSVEIFDNLDAILNREARERLRKAVLLVPSERVVKMVRERGALGPVILADGAHDEAMLRALREWRQIQDADDRDEEQDMSENSQPDSAGQTTVTDPPRTEPESAAAQPAAASQGPAKTKRSGGGLAALAVVIALAAAAGSGYLWWQSRNQGDAVDTVNSALADAQSRLESEMQALRRELTNRDDQFSDLLSDQQGILLKLDGLDAINLRFQSIESELESMRGVSSGARRNWVMAEASYFLQAANASLQLNRNVRSALSALEAADDRLASLADPSLLPVRSVIASERQALSSLPQTDSVRIALTLGSLAARAGSLPTKTDNPAVYATPGEPAGEEGADAGVSRARRVLGDAVKSLVTVRRTDQQASALLAPEEEFFLARNLELQLLTARLALLNEQPELFRQSITTALEWLATFFDPESAEVADTVSTLEEIRKAPVQLSLPDISRSLSLLRAAQARGSAK